MFNLPMNSVFFDTEIWCWLFNLPMNSVFLDTEIWCWLFNLPSNSVFLDSEIWCWLFNLPSNSVFLDVDDVGCSICPAILYFLTLKSDVKRYFSQTKYTVINFILVFDKYINSKTWIPDCFYFHHTLVLHPCLDQSERAS